MLVPCTTPNFGAGCLWATDSAKILPVTESLQQALAPADYCLYEWVDYWLYYPQANRLRIGDTWLAPVVDCLFQVRFENYLGRAELQPFAGESPLHIALPIEVISQKFPTPQEHFGFLSTLLDDLFTRAARLPFTFRSPTSRGVTESLAAPSPLFTLHFLCHYADCLKASLATILASPHRQLCDNPVFARLSEATEADSEVLASILHNPQELTQNNQLPLARRLNGYAPTRVWQRQPDETYDTIENRFVLAFLHALLSAATTLTSQSWWKRISLQRQDIVRETINLLHQTIAHPMFATVGILRHFPSNSQVLWRRDGYCDLLDSWHTFQFARKPLFAPLQHAIDVRDIALLYEMWSFFVLVEEISHVVRKPPVIDLHLSDQTGLGWQTKVRYGTAGELVYNRFTESYSTPLRPDFTWINHDRIEVVFDAKFRLERQMLNAALWQPTDDDETPQIRARRTDLYKMHTYRDALGARAAVSLYPGTESIFYDNSRQIVRDFTLYDLLTGNVSGIGALAMSPT